MQDELTVSALQFNIKLGIIEKNLEQAIDGLRYVSEQGARLVVLPEMWSAGYDYRRLADHAAQTPRILDTLCQLSDELNMVIVGSLPEKVGDNIYNTATVIDGGKVKGSYRKLHMFSTMGEDRFLSPGDKSLVTPTSIGRVGVAICYDLRFPELFRKMALEGAEIICVPAEWPIPRQEHWRTLLRARAIENQLFVVAANCCGDGRLPQADPVLHRPAPADLRDTPLGNDTIKRKARRSSGLFYSSIRWASLRNCGGMSSMLLANWSWPFPSA